MPILPQTNKPKHNSNSKLRILLLLFHILLKSITLSSSSTEDALIRVTRAPVVIQANQANLRILVIIVTIHAPNRRNSLTWMTCQTGIVKMMTGVHAIRKRMSPLILADVTVKTMVSALIHLKAREP
jgi:hypothetical protein